MMGMRIKIGLRLGMSAGAAAMACALPVPAFAQQATYAFDIPAQNLTDALAKFGRTTKRQIVFDGRQTRTAHSQAVRGTMTAEAALAQLLQNTGFASRTGQAGVLIVEASQSAQSQPAPPSAGEAAAGSVAAETESAEDIVVTGTNIRGGASASQTIIIDREDIQRSGLATTQQLVERLPQNFAGNVSETTVGSYSGGLAGNNLALGNGLDLRGIGTDATLVLINGRRVASSAIGNYVDLSLIPLSAVERVEIVADGASAIYGSDAVGGVANFILLDDYEGAETRARFGTVTKGDSKEYQLGQIFGTRWNDGSALVSYEYYERGNLDANDRSFAAETEDPFDLLPDQRRHSAFLTVRQDLSSSVSVFADAIYANRRTKLRATFPGITGVIGAEVDQYGVTAGTRLDVGAGWETEIRGTYDRNKTDQLNPASSDYTGTSWSADGKAEGPLFNIGGGDVRLAVGGQFRREMLDRKSGTEDIHQSSRVLAAFGEVNVPLVGPDNAKPGLQRLELTGAVRLDSYSDFGTTVNPKVGVVWSPIRGMKLRGTYGTAFRAPLLNDLDESSLLYFAFPAADPDSPTGVTNTIVIFGGNEDLQPQKAETFSVGIDYSPPNLPGLRTSATFFGLNYDDRIGSPQSDQFFIFGYGASDLFAPFITRNVDQAIIQEIGTRPGYLDFYGIPLEEVTAIANFQTANLARTEIRGVDASLAYRFPVGPGNVDLGLNATYLIDHKTRFSPAGDLVELVDTRFNPVDLVVNASASWSRGGFTASAFVNYTDSYKDDSSDPEQVFDIDSWTTLDLALAYDTGQSPARSALRNLTFSLSVINLFDTDPPFVRNEFGLNFDGANASPLGRFVSFQVTKKW